MPTVHKIAISTKTRSFGTFSLFFFDRMDLWLDGSTSWIYQSNYSKDSKFTNLNIQPTQSKTLGDYLIKRQWGKDGSFFSFATKCKCRATYDLNVEAISFAIGQGCRSSQLI